MKNKLSVATMWILALLPLAVFLILYARLPETVPIHWNAAGEIDGYGSKLTAGVLFLITPALALMFQFLPKIDPKKQNYEKFSKYYDYFAIFMMVFMGIVNLITLSEAFKPGKLSVDTVISVLVSVMFIFFGNAMGKIKHNYFVGIKTPWTIADPDVWNKTHRIGGIIWVVLGILCLITTFISPIAFIAVMLIGALGSTAYLFIMSYIWFKRKNDSQE